ncbi:cytochrome P450 6j1-like [Onthophagus taurus]|uniref:cytochrome P450 6j1-like n=1 Tax=Onthophagus taurus TaxID=166361 RepID=UPI000C20476D|nr:cytochrome P450 6j1-like [Onthophagus taurus]
MFSLILCSFLVLFLFYKYLTCNYDYWKKRNVNFEPPKLFLGNIPFGQKKNLTQYIYELYQKFPNSPYVGFYMMRTPCLLLTKPEVIEQTLVKDIDFFWQNSFVLDPELDEIAARGAFFQVGQKWKKARNLFTPLFSNAKIKHVTPCLVKASKRMIEYIETKKTLEVRDLMTRFVADSNALSAFGVEAESFDRDDAMYRKLGNQIMEPGRLMALKFFIMVMTPFLAKLLRLRFITEDVVDFVKQTIKTALKHRNENNLKNNDFLDAIMALKSETFDEIDVISWCFGFFTDPNTGNQSGYILYALARNPEVQKKLKSEIDTVLERYNGEITFEAIQEMSYLDCVVSETMRLYPSLQGTSKKCTGYYEFPLEDGQTEVVCLKPGMSVFVSIEAIQKDERYFEKALEFIPERFSEQNRGKIRKGTYMPFGLGKRMCAGMKFAVALMKIATVATIKEFEVSVNEKTVEPFEMIPVAVMAVPKSGIWINFKKRQ